MRIKNSQSEQLNDSNLVNDILENSFANAVVRPAPDRTQDNTDDHTKEYIKTANDQVLISTLAPEITANEAKKREHKDKLITYVSIFLGVQFFVIFVLIMIIIISVIAFHSSGNDMPFATVNMLFAFFGTYITSVIIELICVLKFIIVKVFDTSIDSLVALFNSHEEKLSKEQK